MGDNFFCDFVQTYFMDCSLTYNLDSELDRFLFKFKFDFSPLSPVKALSFFKFKFSQKL